MTDLHLRVDRRGDILFVELNRPERRNALSRALLADLRAAFAEAAADPALRLAVLTGAGDKSFAAGGDLREFEALRTAEDAAALVAEGRAALDAIRRFPVPVVAALNGDALGGGAELALACDFRIAALHSRIGFVQGRLNVTTAWGGGIDLMQRVGPAVGLRLLARAELLDAKAAYRVGLVDSLAAPGESLQAALESFVAPVLAQAPHVLRAFKSLALENRAGAPRRQCEATERDHFVRAWVAEDHWVAAARVLPRR